jgi:cytochrome c-type biogenesis protein CcmH/NrfF
VGTHKRSIIFVELTIFFSSLSPAKDENVRRIMKEIEHLSEDSSKLQQILDLASNLRCPHSNLEDSIRDLQANVQRQLVERQANDSQLNVLELNLNAP